MSVPHWGTSAAEKLPSPLPLLASHTRLATLLFRNDHAFKLTTMLETPTHCQTWQPAWSTTCPLPPVTDFVCWPQEIFPRTFHNDEGLFKSLVIFYPQITIIKCSSKAKVLLQCHWSLFNNIWFINHYLIRNHNFSIQRIIRTALIALDSLWSFARQDSMSSLLSELSDMFP